MRFTSVLLAAAALAVRAPTMRSQTAIVFYDHGPGDTATSWRTSYLRSGDIQTDIRPGVPGVLTVPNGGQVCIRLTHANRLLYNYGVTTAEAPLDTVPGLSEIVQGLGRLAVRTTPADANELYLQEIVSLFDTLLSMQRQVLGTDQQADLAAAVAPIRASFSGAAGVNERANRWFGALNAGDSRVRLLRIVQLDLWRRLVALNDRIERAVAQEHNDLCTSVDARVRLTLAVSRAVAPATGVAPARPMDQVLEVTAEPTDTRRVVVSAGVLMSGFIQDRRHFSERNGVIESRPDHEPIFGPMAVASYRIADSPVWVAVGAAAATDGVSAFFFGLSTSAGHSLTGPGVTLGAGLSINSVVTELKEGTVGAAVPSGKTLDDIVRRERRLGLGVFVALRL